MIIFDLSHIVNEYERQVMNDKLSHKNNNFRKRGKRSSYTSTDIDIYEGVSKSFEPQAFSPFR